jgi:hypothetical protein
MRAAILALAVVGCAPATEAILTLSAGDLNVPTDFDSVHIEVHAGGAPDGTLLSSTDVKLCGLSESGDGCKRMPFTVLLVPGDQKQVPALVEVTARHTGSDVIRDAFVFTFADGQSLRFDLSFYRNCEATLCGSLGLACSFDGTCDAIPGSEGNNLDLSTPHDLAGLDLNTPPRRVFLGGPTMGALGGLAGANMVCQMQADANKLGGKFVAILGTSTDGPKDRLVLDGGARKIVRTDGMVVATDDTFWSPDHLNPIVTDAGGHVIAPANGISQNAWTAFNADGTGKLGAGTNCSGWTTVNDDAVFGDPYETIGPGKWAYYAATGCANPLHLYCIEQ